MRISGRTTDGAGDHKRWGLTHLRTHREEAIITRYFTAADYHPKALLRRTGQTDEAFVAGVWRPTTSIMECMVGNDDFVDEITEAQARAFKPEAFA